MVFKTTNIVASKHFIVFKSKAFHKKSACFPPKIRLSCLDLSIKKIVVLGLLMSKIVV